MLWDAPVPAWMYPQLLRTVLPCGLNPRLHSHQLEFTLQFQHIQCGITETSVMAWAFARVVLCHCWHQDVARPGRVRWSAVQQAAEPRSSHWQAPGFSVQWGSQAPWQAQEPVSEELNNSNSYNFNPAPWNQTCHYLKPFQPHTGHQKGLFWFNPGWQLSTTQVIHSFPLQRMSEKSEG